MEGAQPLLTFYLPQLPGVAIEEQMGGIVTTVASIEPTLRRVIFGRQKMLGGDTRHHGGRRQSGGERKNSPTRKLGAR